MHGFMWRCRASGCILVLNVAMHYNGSDRMHWFQGSASAVLMCGCSTHNPVCSVSTVYCMTVWLHDLYSVWLLQGNLANASCHQPLHSLRRICGSGGTHWRFVANSVRGQLTTHAHRHGVYKPTGGNHFSCYPKSAHRIDYSHRYGVQKPMGGHNF